MHNYPDAVRLIKSQFSNLFLAVLPSGEWIYVPEFEDLPMLLLSVEDCQE